MRKLWFIFLLPSLAFAQLTNVPVNVGTGPNAQNGDPLRTAFTSLDTDTNQLTNAVNTLLTNQPNASTLTTGTVPCAQLPAQSGDVNTSGCAASVTGLNGVQLTSLNGLIVDLNGTIASIAAPTSAVVGINDTQTLVNKTISGGSNTITNIPSNALPSTIAANTTGNAATATQLQGTPTNCTYPQVPTGINSSGNAVGCASPLVSSLPTTSLTGSLQAAQEPAHVGDATNSAGSLTLSVKGLNGQTLSNLSTGLLKNTTGTGMPSIAVPGTDYLSPSSTVTPSQITPQAAGSVLGVPAQNSSSSAPSVLARPTLYMADYGVKCDNSTDDTVAIQAFFTALDTYSKSNWINGVGMPGVCRFSSKITIAAASNRYWDFSGAGKESQLFYYIGASTTTDLIAITGAATNNLASKHVISGFNVQSGTTMTAGAALHIKNAANIYLRDFSTGAQNDVTTNTMWNGTVVEESSQIKLQNFDSSFLLNEGLQVFGQGVGNPPQYDLSVDNCHIAGNAGTGIHVGGGWDAFQADDCTVVGNKTNVVIDHALASFGNQEILFGPRFYANAPTGNGSNIGDNYLINDSSATTANLCNITIAGPVTLSPHENGINVQSWPACPINVTSTAITNNARSGIYVQDTTALVNVSPTTNISSNSRYAIEASASTSNVKAQGNMTGNTLGTLLNVASNASGYPSNAGTMLSYGPCTGTQAAPTANASTCITGSYFGNLSPSLSSYSGNALGLNALELTGGLSGSVASSSGYSYADINVSTDTIASAGSHTINAFTVEHAFGGGSATGGFQGMQATAVLQAPTANTSGQYSVAGFIGQFNTGDGGTSEALNQGSLFGLNPNVRLLSGSTFVTQLVGQETDIAALGFSITGVTITGTGGQFSGTPAGTLIVGQTVYITGTFGGTGSITGYVNGATYLVSATNGTSTFTLTTVNGSALTTTTGTPTGLTYVAGASVADNIGQQIVDGATSVPGLRMNVGYALSNGNSAGLWDVGFDVGEYSGYWPMSPNGSIVGCWPHAQARPATGVSCGTTAYGIDFAGLGEGGAVTFTGAPFTSNGFKIDPSGHILNNTPGGNVYLGADAAGIYNGVEVTPSTTGNTVTIQGIGVDATQNLAIKAAGTAFVGLGDSTGGYSLIARGSGGATADYWNFTPAMSANPAVIQAAPGGTDANVILDFRPKGNGFLRFSAGTDGLAFAVQNSANTNSYLTVDTSAGIVATSLLKLPFYTVSTLPTCNAANHGTMARVTDATTPTYNGALTGSGAVEIPVYCNGTAWSAH